MKTIRTSQQSAGDSKLHLELPVDKLDHTYHVAVVLNDEAENSTPQPNGLPEGYRDSVIGKWDGDFVGEPERPFEPRKSL